MPNQKGAFQLSLGFIVSVIFAVILLTLALAWLQGLFEDIGSVTHKVTDVARSRMMEELSTSGKKVGIAAPAVTEWRKSETGSYALGIRNDEDIKRMLFSIGVYLVNEGPSLSSKPEVAKWFDATVKTKLIEPGERDSVDLIIKPPAGTKSGIYTIRIVVCKDTDTCDESDYTTASSKYYGAEEFSMEILEG